MLRIAAGAMACDIEPAMGGCLKSLRLHGIDVLRPTPGSVATARQSSSYPLVPWSNRIGEGLLRWRGRTVRIERNNAPEPHAIHGTGWQDAWQVVAQHADRVELSLAHRADARWPFAFEASQALAVSESGLDMTLSVTNRSHEPMPAGLGWHPFFAKRPGARVRVRAKGRWEMSAGKLPTQHVSHTGLDTVTDALDVDHCFDGWDGEAELGDHLLRITVSSALRHIVVFTHPSRDIIAIEPVTHANNIYGDPAIASQTQHDLGITELAPGETLTAGMRIAVAAA
ncbi:aldose 1-epimerase [Ramlibacter humi]|uniref:Aldose 1-epimerase n=1 Tax=Ramlibacter humi TaxID=2530451 RepID=A0A4Z0BG58_9BURK|nr:aldose 1-epimerase [Ramlibacter humi]TFY97711.1 aldose 1-epimerase [Ramlibacter humi]